MNRQPGGQPDRGLESRTPDPGARTPVSVLITARDEEAQLPAALASVAAWAAEVLVVVDPRTTDATRDVGRGGGATVVEHPFESSSQQLAWGLERCAHDWVFVLDADERVVAALGDAIRAAAAGAAHAAYSVARRNLAFGRRLRFGDWGGDRVTRLVDRRRIALAGGMHWRVEAASVGRLPGVLLHDTLRSLDQYLPKLHDYARRGAEDALARGATSGPVTIAARCAWRFVRAYLLRLGVLDGGAGLVVAGLGAYGAFLKWTRVWQQTTKARPQP